MKKSILIIEDEYSIIKPIGEKLKRGYSVDVAKNGTEAVGYLEKGGYSLIILDIMMPHGKEISEYIPAERTGIELLRMIREKSPLIPVMVLTAVTEARSINELKKHRPDKVFYKPVDPEIFYTSVIELLEGGGEAKHEPKN
ncbi:MAG: response regulator [Nitrospirota bacterium]